MDIAILLYDTCEVKILRNVDEDLIDDVYDGNVELYLNERGYSTNNSYYMCGDDIIINEV